MITKVFGYSLGGLILLIFGLVMFWTPLQEGITTNNTTWANANYTATQAAIRFTPAILVIAVIATPLVLLVLYKWSQRSAG